MSRFDGKTVAVVGLSIEGKDTVEFFLHTSCTILCCDRRNKEEFMDLRRAFEGKPVTFYFGKNYLQAVKTADVIVRTPGMSLRTPELIHAQSEGKEITSATKLFFEFCQAPIIGVTGTKGKGTTATLIAEMLRAGNKQVYVGGNVGTPLLSKVLTIKPFDWVVMELSSFQLEDLTRSPHIAVVLRITQDHLANFDKHATNFHPTRADYIKAKMNIISHQHAEDIAILNAGDPVSDGFARFTPADVVRFDRYGRKAECYVENHTVYLCENGRTEKICSRDDVRIRGDHNLENIAAAALAARCAGVSFPAIRTAAKTFSGLEHRLQFIRKIRGVSYFDDSFSTVPETAIAAIEAFEEPKVLILGGSEKISDFTEMGQKIADSNVIAVVVIGQMTDRIVDALKRAGYKGTIVTGLRVMAEIVRKTKELGIPGSVVLLSPACASFDMFANYKERGKLFTHEVLSLT